MKNTVILIFLMVSFLLVACNHQTSHKAVIADTLKAPLPITSSADSLSITDDTDYAHATITVSNKAWEEFNKKYHYLNLPIVSFFDKKNNDTNLVSGDFNGDGIKEKMYIVPPVFRDTLSALGSEECMGGCNSYLIFSDTSLQVFRVSNNLGGTILNAGDLDGDGADDILVNPDWWQSNWNPYKLFSYNRLTRSWNYLVEPIAIFANDMEGKELVRRSKRKGFIKAFTSKTDEEGNIHSGYAQFKIIKQ